MPFSLTGTSPTKIASSSPGNPYGIVLHAALANTDSIKIMTDPSTADFDELSKGDSIFVVVENNDLWALANSGTQTLNVPFTSRAGLEVATKG